MLKKNGVDQLTNFLVADYTHTNFPDSFFDTIYGIESICYAKPKSAFLKEAYRLLKPGGRLVISDGYKKRDPQNDLEKSVYNQFLYGYNLKELITAQEMSANLKMEGFIHIRSVSKLDQVYPSVQYYARLAQAFLPIAWLFRSFSPLFEAMYKNGTAAINSYKGIKIGIADYRVHSAQKPK